MPHPWTVRELVALRQVELEEAFDELGSACVFEATRYHVHVDLNPGGRDRLRHRGGPRTREIAKSDTKRRQLIRPPRPARG